MGTVGHIPSDPAAGALAAALSALLLVWFAVCCAAISVYDLRSRRIPNALVAACAIGACAQAVLHDLAGLGVLPSLPPAPQRLAWALATLLAGFGFEALWRRTHDGSHGMGYGDVKFAAALALWVGPMIPALVCAACLAAALAGVAARRRAVPLGPFLALSSGACLLVSLTP